MEDINILISHILDLKERAADTSVITFTNFLTPEERSLIFKTEKVNSKYVKTFYYGGYYDAERVTAVFVPSFYEIQNDFSDFLNKENANHISLIKVVKDKFSVLSHRDYLGALMGLGLKREMIGDIVITEWGCYIFALKSVASFICNNLHQAGKGQLNCSICSINELSLTDNKTETLFISVASLRLDCLVAACFNLSRTNANEFIERGTVYINSIQCFKADALLKQGDKLVLRGKGKVLIYEIIGKNKKGRIHLNIKRYI